MRGRVDYQHLPLPSGNPSGLPRVCYLFPLGRGQGQGGDPMWQKLRLYCACGWGEGQHAGQGSTCPAIPRALSAKRVSLTSEWSARAGRGRETAVGSNKDKATKSARSPHQPGGHTKLSPWDLRRRIWQIFKGSIWGLGSSAK